MKDSNSSNPCTLLENANKSAVKTLFIHHLADQERLESDMLVSHFPLGLPSSEGDLDSTFVGSLPCLESFKHIP